MSGQAQLENVRVASFERSQPPPHAAQHGPGPHHPPSTPTGQGCGGDLGSRGWGGIVSAQSVLVRLQRGPGRPPPDTCPETLSSTLVPPGMWGFCLSTGAPRPRTCPHARMPRYLWGPQKEGWAANTGQPLRLRRAHHSLQAQVAQVTGICIPTSLCHLKAHFTKTDTRKTSALPTGGTKGQVPDNTPASSFSEEGFCGSVASPPPHHSPSPTSHPPHCAATPQSLPQSRDQRKALLKLLFPGVEREVDLWASVFSMLQFIVFLIG